MRLHVGKTQFIFRRHSFYFILFEKITQINIVSLSETVHGCYCGKLLHHIWYMIIENIVILQFLIQIAPIQNVKSIFVQFKPWSHRSNISSNLKNLSQKWVNWEKCLTVCLVRIYFTNFILLPHMFQISLLVAKWHAKWLRQSYIKLFNTRSPHLLANPKPERYDHMSKLFFFSSSKNMSSRPIFRFTKHNTGKVLSAQIQRGTQKFPDWNCHGQHSKLLSDWLMTWLPKLKCYTRLDWAIGNI